MCTLTRNSNLIPTNIHHYAKNAGLQRAVPGQNRVTQISGTWWTKFSTVALNTVSIITAEFFPA